MWKFSLPVILFSFLFLSCEYSVDSLGDENLRITTNQMNVLLTNTSDEKLEFILLEYETSTLIDLGPDTQWPVIEVNSTLRVPYSEIMGYQSSSTEAFIMWRNVNRSYQNSLKFNL
jgi:hypothetical protein